MTEEGTGSAPGRWHLMGRGQRCMDVKVLKVHFLTLLVSSWPLRTTGAVASGESVRQSFRSGV